ncbi:helix-turn-helix transcriptional regulator [Streptomyces sp. DSM 41524]|uniref:Helix-turn-helix transcriptional regulator n=1 Tax=Streptomyces asiaticus subsp. ignotus TaxID=3098222 RepID=A0ABU7PPR9_9ACTN|nr:helix-turn-helix transcriptional regulator [Streptomyces sp. DSM 41524]
MPASPSSSAQAAREALAVRLTHLARDAGITGRELSARCGWHPAKTSRILRAKAAPSEADIRAWCAACSAQDQTADLIATARAVDSMYLEWRRQHRDGMRRTQQDVLARTAAARLCRAYTSNVIPGFFQTAGYAEALMRSITDFQDTPDDIPEAVAARLARSRFLYEGDHRFVVLIEEWVLRTRISSAETMAGQLAHLLTVMPLPSVSLGIIPLGAPRTVWPLEAFYLYDDHHAVVETLTAGISIRQPRELADYARAFTGLSRMAVHGDAARARIRAAIDALN